MADDSLTDWKAAHRTLSREHSEAEEQLGMLQNLYSTSIQLLAARVPADVLKVVAEVLENLIGASGFSLFVWRPGERRARVVLRRGAGRASRASRRRPRRWAACRRSSRRCSGCGPRPVQ